MVRRLKRKKKVLSSHLGEGDRGGLGQPESHLRLMNPK